MRAKQKPASSKEKWQAERARYAWHMRPPFRNTFDRSHWWRNQSDVDSIAALYELARRHPRVGELRLRFRRASWYGQESRDPLVGAAEREMASQACHDLGKEPDAIHCLCLIGLKSWPALGSRNQEFWEMSAGRLKGVDCRHDIERCASVTREGLADILIRRMVSLNLGKGAFQFWVEPGRKNMSVNPVDLPAFVRAQKRLAKHLQQKPISRSE